MSAKRPLDAAGDAARRKRAKHQHAADDDDDNFNIFADLNAVPPLPSASSAMAPPPSLPPPPPPPLPKRRDVNEILAEIMGEIATRDDLIAGVPQPNRPPEPFTGARMASAVEEAIVREREKDTREAAAAAAAAAAKANRGGDDDDDCGCAPDAKKRHTTAPAEEPARSSTLDARTVKRRLPRPSSSPLSPPPAQRRQPNCLSADRFLQHVVRQDIAHEAENLVRTRVHAKWEHAQMADASRIECTGAKRVRALRGALKVLAENGYPWSKQQQICIEAWITQSLPSYYRDELHAHLFELLKAAGTSEIRTESATMMQRRGGKTTVASGFCACEIATQPDHDVLCYSNNMRASKMMLLTVYKQLKILAAHLGGHIKSLNKNESLTFVTRDGYENEMFAYPAKPENLRGTGSKKASGTVIAEEFGFMDVRVVFQIIGPTLTRKNVKFIGITTVNPDDSFVTPLTEAKFPDGRSVFLTLNFELVCAECKKAGRALQCRCLMGDIPEWQSSDQIDKLSLLMGATTFLTEIKGMAIDETITPAFHQVSVEFLRTQEAIMQTGDLYAKDIYIAIDPAAGGKHSRFAMVAAIFIGRNMIIVGSAAINTDRPESQSASVVAFIQALRALHGLETSRIVIAPEANYAMEGKRIAMDVARARVEGVFCLREDVRGNEGIRMTEALKKEMVLSFNALLMGHHVRWHPFMVALGSSAEEQRKGLVDELARYQRQLIYNERDPAALPKERFHGKIGGAADDRAIAVQLVQKSREFWLAKPEFYSNLRPLWTPAN